MKRLILIGLSFVLVLMNSVVSAQFLVKGYYGDYQIVGKRSGHPAPSFKEPVSELWVMPTPKREYHIGVLIPHLKDSYWIAANYGLITHAEKLGIKITIKSVTGYGDFGDQRHQFLEMAQDPAIDGIVLSTVDYLKMDKYVERVVDSGKPVVGMINDIHAPDIAAKAMVSYYDAGYKTGRFVVKDSNNRKIRVAVLPGPENAGWAADMYNGFVDAMATAQQQGQQIEIIYPLYGDTRVKVQRLRLSLLLKEIDTLDYVVGNAVAATEAVKIFATKSQKLKIVSFYITGDVYDQIKRGTIKAAPFDQTIKISEIALDMMVRTLNGEKPGRDFPFRAGPEYLVITTENVDQYRYEDLFGERDFKPVVSTDR